MTADHLPHPPTSPRLAGLLAALAALFGVVLVQDLDGASASAETSSERLTSRPLLAAPRVPAVAIGEEIRTGGAQRRRVQLPGGSILYLNQNTTVRLDTTDRLTLSRGEVFVEAALPRRTTNSFVVKTAKRAVSGPGAKFAVRAGEDGTRVIVARGTVKVSGLEGAVVVGQQLPAGSAQPVPAPRLSHLLAWTRDLMSAAESPLVPGSKHAGGALIAIDPDGQEAKLSLRRYHVDVHLEDGFARTTIDQTYFNHEAERLEGTFYFPLPPDASLSRLAMYVDGNLMEGGMAERDYARQVYERILYQQRDPALLEWVDGSTFKMRVFPLEGRQEKRIILSYTQKLPSLYGQVQYRFPAGHSLQVVRDWSFHARVKNGSRLVWTSASHPLRAVKEGADLVLDAEAKSVKVDRDVQLTVAEPPALAGDVARFCSAEHDGARYLMLRFRPNLPTGKQQSTSATRRDWVFLFESSGDRDPLLARVQIELIRHLLSHAGPDDTFAVLAAGTRVRVFAREPRPVTPENVQAAVAFLDKVHLIGALDLGRALSAAQPLLKLGKNPYLVHTGSGIAAMGERRRDVLAKRIPAGTQYVGVGVGRRWGRDFMKAAAEGSGGYFTQVNPDEPVAWRAFELFATLNTPRLLNVGVADSAGRVVFLPFTSSLAQGEELGAIARLGPEEKTLPESVTISGVLDGQPLRRVLPVKDVADKANYLPRTWARLEIERLLAEDAVKHKKQIVALSKAMYVMTPFTSLLVLENEDMYTQFKVDRGRQDHWAMYPCPKKIPVVREDDSGQPNDQRKARRTAKLVRETILKRDRLRFLKLPAGSEGQHFRGPVNAVALPAMGVIVTADAPARNENLRDAREMPAREAPPRDFLIELVRPNPSARVGQILIGGNALPHPSRFQFWMGMYASQDRLFDRTKYKLHLEAPQPDRLFRLESAAEAEASPMPSNGQPAPPTPMLSGDMNDFVYRLLSDSANRPSLLYHRPSFSGDDRLFFDLAAYAPGLNTSRADIRAVLEAEATLDPGARLGRIDAAARQMLAETRVAGWQALTIPAEGACPAYTITFDGKGRYTYQRLLPPGLPERVICDGKTLLHLYPNLGLAARRTVSRFHRLDFAVRVPWALPHAEDLARGADLKRVAPRTLALIPHRAAAQKDAHGKPIPYARLHLVFAADGRLIERQVVRMPAGKILSRQTCATDGTIKLLDALGKELVVRKCTLGPAREPSLTADIRNLVVLPLPFRSREHVLQALKIKDKPYQNLRFADALRLFAADVAAGNTSEARKVFQEAFHGRDQRQLGFYVLLAACGQNLDADNANVMAEHLDEPLAQYLTLHSSPLLRKHASQWAVGSRQWAGGFLQHLAVSHALYQRWQNDKILKGSPARRRAEIDRALDYIRRNQGSVFGWALLGLIQDRAGNDPTLHRALARLWPLFESVNGLNYVARYEHARSLWKAGDRDEARRRFRALYHTTLKEDRLPLIDADFRLALLGSGKEADQWDELLRQTAAQLIEKKRRPAVLALAWQCWQLEDRPLANHLLSAALEGTAAKERLPMTLAGIEFLWHTGQLAQADRLLGKLQADPKLARRAALWRLRSKLAERRELTAQSLEYLEQALECEYQDLPEVINLQEVRADYGKLLEHYRNLADAMVALKIRPPVDFVARVVRGADRWRALDHDGAPACQSAGRILQTLQERDLSWDYLTTPVGLRPNEAAPWLKLARTLGRQGELDLADRAYAAAFEAEPTNAQILWDRADHLRQAGKTVQARQLFRQIVEGHWQPRFHGLQVQASLQVKGG